MSEEKKCGQCGAPMSPGAPEGLCPACLLKRGFETQTGAPAADFTPPSPEELALSFPQLEILELLGRGGMGAVYKARQRELDRMVALKILPSAAERDPAFAERFAREARALARLGHPNIVAVYDFGQAGGLFYFVMEYVDGLNLRQLLATAKITPEEALAIVPQICEALQTAHDQGIVHRDIKPENILLDKKGRVKIADFGIAKIMGGEERDMTLTGAGEMVGTPAYMAPEQIEHPREVDHRADIYSLGVVFYQMLTGELPLGKFAPPSARMRGVRIDVRLDDVVLRALEKEPELRYQQASEVRTQVETITKATGAGVNFQPDLATTPPPSRFAWLALLLLLLGLLGAPFLLALSPHQEFGLAFGALSLLLALVFGLLDWRARLGRGVALTVILLLAAISLYRLAIDADLDKEAHASAPTKLQFHAHTNEPPKLRFLAWLDEIQTNPHWQPWLVTGKFVKPADMPPSPGLCTPSNVEVSSTGTVKEKPRFLCLWISDPGFDTQSVTEFTLLDGANKPLEVPTHDFAIGVTPPGTGTENLGWIMASLCVGSMEKTPSMLRLQLNYSAGPWHYWDDLAPDFHGSMALGNGVLVTDPGQGSDGKAFVQWTRDHSLDTGTAQFDFVAVTKDGRRLDRISHSESGTGSVKIERSTFDVPLDQVKTFQCRKRPIHSILWSSIPLQKQSPIAVASAPPA